jgi:DNA replication and repair protein RecF
MSRVLQELRLHNFRNHQLFLIENPENLVIIIGDNAIGKTNIIEALQLVSMLESFRNPLWHSVVKNGELSGDIQAQFHQNERHLDIRLDIQEGKRIYSLNGKKRTKSALKGLIPTVIFVPDDLNLVKDSAEVRRGLLDDIGQQLSSTYQEIFSDYQKTVRQRNILLKEYRERELCRGGSSPLPDDVATVLESWDENFLLLSSLLFIHRMRLYRRLIEKATELYQQLSKGERLTSKYCPAFSKYNDDYTDEELLSLKKEEVEGLLRSGLDSVRNEEKIRGKTLIGPHRDEFVLFIDGHNARQYGSQGQQRSIALALKLAQLAVIRDISDKQPLLLLDDVMSELDEKRRAALIDVIGQHTQTFITATDLSSFNEMMLKNARIINLGQKKKQSEEAGK